MLNLRDHKEQGPAAACLFSPWTYLTATGPSVKTNRDRDPALAIEIAQTLATAYAGEADLRTPLISPLYGDFAGLPRMVIFAGDTEILLKGSPIARAEEAFHKGRTFREGPDEGGLSESVFG
jgi:epsilon-lactone hydrolase